MLSILSSIFGFSSLLKVIPTLVETIAPAIKGLIEFSIWYLKEVYQGTKVILANSSTWAVLLIVVLATGWYSQTINDQSILKQCNHQSVKAGKKVTHDYQIKMSWPFD